MSWQPDASIDMLRIRAAWLKSIRQFFDERDVLEVETPVLAPSTIPDPHIESLKTCFQKQTYYLQTSPEFYMKRLLAAGSGAIYQLSRVFRDDERGRLHNPEFTLLEWYRPGFDQAQLMTEVADLVQVLWGKNIDVQTISYQSLFESTVNINPLKEDWDAINQYCQQHQLQCPVVQNDGWDVAIDWLLSCVIQPQMQGSISFIYDYPASQASLARIDAVTPDVAKRFELYIDGIEIANGFEELTDSREQRERFEAENMQRKANGQAEIPLDEKFLSAIDAMPSTSGVALGVDRLLMLARNQSAISNTMAFAWQDVTDS